MCSPEFRTSNKDPNAPKRPRSAYIWFCLDQRSVVKDDLGDAQATEITSELGKRWNELKKRGKVDKYEKQAADDKIRYNNEVKNGVDTIVDDTIEEENVTTETTTKKKNSSFQNFCEQHRGEYERKHPNAKASDIQKRLSKSWKALDKSEKKQYKQVRVSK